MSRQTSTTSREFSSESRNTSDPYTVTSSRVTTYESRSPGYQLNSSAEVQGGVMSSSNDANYVRPIVSNRSVIINRTASDPFGRGGFERSSQRSMSMMGASAGYSAGAFTAAASSGVGAVKESRDREKRDMQDLNERFANYVEKVRFLEAQNRKLAAELEKLKTKWGQETSNVKAMYQVELDEARRLLDEAVKDKARLEIKMAALEDYVEEMKQRLDDANKAVGDWKEKWESSNQQLSDYEAEIGQLRRRMEGFETDREKDKKLILQLQEQLNRARLDLDNESLSHVDAESRRQSLEEEVQFLKAIHDQEMKEMAALVNRDSTAENRAYWKSEMGMALKEIQQMYDDKMDTMRAEIESSYNSKVQEFRTGASRNIVENSNAKEESKRLKTHITDLRDKLGMLEAQNASLQRELESLRQEKEQRERDLEFENTQLRNDVVKLRSEIEAIMREFQCILDSKLGMELEIAAYRKLLEGEESRISQRSAYQSNWSSSSDQMDKMDSKSSTFGGSQSKGEMSARTTFQRSAKGSCSISECSADGKFVALENNSRSKEESLGSWIVKRNIDGVDKVEYVLDKNFTLPPLANVKIWAKGTKPYGSPATDLEANIPSWYAGADITTKLINTAGEERASHVQKTIYTT